MTFTKNRYTSLSQLPVDEGLSPQPLTDKDVTPPPGYTPLKTHLPLQPAGVTMAQVWGLKKTICSALHLQDHALLLKGYMVGSTDVVFYLASSAAVTPKEPVHIMMSSDVIVHSMVLGYGTEHEVRRSLAPTPHSMLLPTLHPTPCPSPHCTPPHAPPHTAPHPIPSPHCTPPHVFPHCTPPHAPPHTAPHPMPLPTLHPTPCPSPHCTPPHAPPHTAPHPMPLPTLHPTPCHSPQSTPPTLIVYSG